jgi:hypothetical protein
MQNTYTYTAQAIGPRGFSVFLAFADTETGDGFSREQLNKRYISFVIATEEPPQAAFTKWTQHVGDSAYMLAVKDGFVGTKEEWLASLNGASHWDDVDGKPLIYPTNVDNVDGLQLALTEIRNSIPDWDSLVGKPSVFPSAPHDHDGLYDRKTAVDSKITTAKNELQLAITNAENTLNARITTEVATLNTAIGGKSPLVHEHTQYDTIVSVDGKINGLKAYTNTEIATAKTSLTTTITNSETTLNARITAEVATLNTAIGGKSPLVHEHTQYDTIVSVDGKIGGLRSYVDTQISSARSYTDTKFQGLKTEVDNLDASVTTRLATKQNRIITASIAPLNPSTETIWIDSSTTPHTLKLWSGGAWIPVGYTGVVAPLVLTGVGTTSGTHPLLVKNAAGVEILKASDNGIVTANIKIKDWNGLQLQEVDLLSAFNNDFIVRHKNGTNLLFASLTRFSAFSLTATATKVDITTDLAVNGSFTGNAASIKTLTMFPVSNAELGAIPKGQNITVFNSDRNRHEFFDVVNQKWRPLGVDQVDTDLRYVLKSGDTMRGFLNITGIGITDATKPFSIRNSNGDEKVYITDGGAIYADRFNGFRIDPVANINTIARRDWDGYLQAQGVTLNLGVISGPESGIELRAQDPHTNLWSWRDLKVKNIASENTIQFRTIDRSDYQGIESLTSWLRGYTTAQRDAIPTPKPGLQVYNTTTKQYEFFNGIKWSHHGITQVEMDDRYLKLAGGNILGKLGVGVPLPVSKVHVKGDIEIEDFSTGVILRSPDGNRWRLVIDNTGAINSEKL